MESKYSFVNSFMTEVVIICSANQWTGFYMITASVMKELRRRDSREITLIDLAKFVEDEMTLVNGPPYYREAVC